MKKYYHQKLIRDKIPQWIESQGGQYETKVLSSRDYPIRLKQKLIEEAQELAKAPKVDLINELADIWELFKTITDYHHLKVSDIKKYAARKKQQRGGFRKRLFLIWSDKPTG